VTTIEGLRPQSPGKADPSVSFPTANYPFADSFCSAYFSEWTRAAGSIDLASVSLAAATLVEAYRAGSRVFSCGNGGSASIANHLQCDHLKGIRNETDLLPKVISLNSNVELLTAIANDISYEDVFKFQLESQSRPGDVLIAISSSGRSANIVRALRWARDHRLRTIALTGFDGGPARRIAEVVVHVDCGNYGVVEDLHQATMHALAQYIRQSRMTAEAIASTVF
jgi:phosphoheptose isomerase